MTPNILDFILKSFITVPVLTVVGSFLTIFSSWAVDMNSSSRRERLVKEISERIECWEAMRQAEQKLSSDSSSIDNLMRAEIDFLARRLKLIRLQELGGPNTVGVVRRFLLVYRMNTLLGRFCRSVFYLCLLSPAIAKAIWLYLPRLMSQNSMLRDFIPSLYPSSVDMNRLKVLHIVIVALMWGFGFYLRHRAGDFEESAASVELR